MAFRGAGRWRILAYALTAALIVSLCLLLQLTPAGAAWRGDPLWHTLSEVVATLVALMVAVLALVRFYSRPRNVFLFIGSGFLGTALLDGYDAAVTGPLLRDWLPSHMTALVQG